VSILPGVGPATVTALASEGLRTVGDIAGADLKWLVKVLGSGGLRLHHLAHGRDTRLVDPEQERKTISAETTFNDDLYKREDLEDELWPLCEKVARQARAGGVAGRVATLKLRTPDFKIHTRRRTLPVPTQTARTLFQVARELLAAEPGGLHYRLIGAGLTDFVPAEGAGRRLLRRRRAQGAEERDGDRRAAGEVRRGGGDDRAGAEEAR
jgi:DNA polymerase-4